MSVTAALAIYFIIWWTLLFCVLPLNVRSQAETGEVAEGTEPGAPADPQLLRKAAITTVLSAIVFAVVFVIWTWVDA